MSKETGRRAVVALLGAVVLVLGACAQVGGEVARARVYRDSERVGFAAVTSQAASSKTPKNRYLAIQARKNRTDAQASIVLPCDLWAPFRWEITGGVFDLDYLERTDGAIFGTELDQRGAFPPTVYYGVAAQVTNGGLNAYAFSHTSGTSLGSHFFAGATRVDFAIEADGTNMTFYARANGNTIWETLASVPFSGQTQPLNPSIGAYNFGDKAKVGYDDARLVANGVAPHTLSPEQEVARLVWEAARGILDSMNGLDGSSPDLAGAETDLTDALAVLSAARTATDAIEDGKLSRKADKDVKKISRQVSKALKKVGKEKASSAAKRCEKAFKRVLKAVHRVDPL